MIIVEYAKLFFSSKHELLQSHGILNTSPSNAKHSWQSTGRWFINLGCNLWMLNNKNSRVRVFISAVPFRETCGHKASHRIWPIILFFSQNLKALYILMITPQPFICKWHLLGITDLYKPKSIKLSLKLV